MSVPEASHRPLLAGLKIHAGVPKGTGKDANYFASGTLTGLATRDADGKPVLVTNAHNMASRKAETNPVGNEVMAQGGEGASDRVGANLMYYTVTTTKNNIADIATLDPDEGVTAEFAMHSSHPHTGRVIIEGTAEPEVDMKLVMLGGVTGERTVTVDQVEKLVEQTTGNFANGFMVMSPSIGKKGDSGAPLLLKVRDGVYRMVGVMSWRSPSDHREFWAFPASAGEFAMGITFGVKLEDLAAATQSGFTPSLYSGWEAAADFSSKALGLTAIEVSGGSKKWVGGRIPHVSNSTTPNWWDATLVTVADVPTSVRLTIHGGPDTHPWFTAGQVWGFRVYIKRTTDSAWRQVLGGSDILAAAGFTSGSDKKAMAVAELTVPITTNAERWLEYFKPYRRDSTGGDFEVRIDGAPALPAGVEFLGTLPEGDTTRKGSWSSDVASVNRPRCYARFYAFRLNRRGKVRLSLDSSTDPYMFLLAGAGKNGAELGYNDDYDYPNTLNSRITRTLNAGDYTIEATTFSRRRAGEFNVTARLLSDDATLSGLALSVGDLSPAFAAGKTSYTASVGHARSAVTVTPTANHGLATITVNGATTTSGTASVALSLLVGANTISVVVTAEDGARQTYTITVTRAADDTIQWGPWTETSETRGRCDDWEIKETRTGTRGNGVTQTQERWVSWEGPAETWGAWSSWSSTGRERGAYREREIERERTRTSNRCRTQTETSWVSSPVEPPETWGRGAHGATRAPSAARTSTVRRSRPEPARAAAATLRRRGGG